MTRKLLPPKNVRRVTPRVCATCKHLITYSGWQDCDRGGVSLETGDRYDILTTCDRWASGIATLEDARE